MNRPGLSVAIITLNEERKLPACLESAGFADEIVIVDCGSSDMTVEIAEGRGAKVFVEDWKGFGPQKQSAVKKCLNEWVLVLDADERVSPEAKDEILRAVSKSDCSAYSLPRRNFFHGKWIRHADFWPDRQVKLVRKSEGGFEGYIHEKWVTPGKTGLLVSPIDHYSFDDYSSMLRTMDKYSTDTAREMREKGIRASALSPAYHALAMFLKIYFVKLGILEGIDGLVIALTKAGGSFFKYAKLLELQRRP